MKDRSQHAALGSATRISQGKIDLQEMVIAFQYRAVGGNIQPADGILEAIQLGRHARGTHDANHVPSGETLDERVVVEFEPADSWLQSWINSGTKIRHFWLRQQTLPQK